MSSVGGGVSGPCGWRVRDGVQRNPQGHRPEEEDGLGDVVDFRTAEGMDEGEAGIFDGVRDGGLPHKFVLEPGRGRGVVHANHAAKALDVSVDDLDATCVSGVLRKHRRLTRSLLDLGLGGVSLYA